jgi:cold-inducible RNA-binding protein
LGKKLYVGNLPYSATEAELRQLFEQHGAVVSITVITDRDTGMSRGYGFVEMEAPADAETAIRALDGQEFGGRNLRVNEAQERRGGGGGPRGGPGGGGRGGFGGGGGGGFGGGGGGRGDKRRERW